MEIAAIVATVTKGAALAQTLVEAGKDAGPAIAALSELLAGGQSAVTPEKLAACEATLDALLDEFNAPLPPADQAGE